jgi:hypothetical protein
MWFKNIKQCFANSRTNPEFLVYVDNDDPQLEQYKEYAEHLKELDLKLIIDKPLRSAPAMKFLAQQASKEYMIFGTDDLDWKTPGWDEKLISKMPSHGLGVVFPASISGNKVKAPIPFFTKKWRDLTGLWPDLFVHFGPDGYIARLSEQAGTKVFACNVEILHSKIRDETSGRARINGTSNWKSIIDSQMPKIKEIAEKIKEQINR